MVNWVPPRGFAYYFCLSLVIALTFLCLDFLRRFELLLNVSPTFIAMNWATVTLVAVPACILTAGFCMLLEAVARRVKLKEPRELANILLFTGFGWLNLLFLKYRLVESLYQLDRPERVAVLLVSLALIPLAYLRVRPSLNAWAGKGFDTAARWVLGFYLVLVPISALASLGLREGAVAATPSPERPPIILLTFDGLSAQDLSVYGCPQPTTPHLDELARESLVFTQTHSVSTSTRLGLLGFQGQYHRGGQNLSDLLREAGYDRQVFVSFWDSAAFHLRGMDESLVVRAAEQSWWYAALNRVYSRRALLWLAALGTEEAAYFNLLAPDADDMNARTSEHYPAQLVLQRGLEVLQRRPHNTFLWIHLFQPHYPFLPDKAWVGKFGGGPDERALPIHQPYPPSDQARVDRHRARYWEYIRSVDDRVGDFLSDLKRSGLYDSSILVVSADHGESFEDGWFGHVGPLVHRAVTNIPFLIRFPGARAETVEIFTPVSPVDLAPTLLDWLELPVPASLAGESLLPYIGDPRRLSTRPRLTLSDEAATTGKGEMAVISGRFKLVYRREDPQQARLYDLYADPLGTRDLAAEYPEVVESLKSSFNLRLRE